MKCPICEGKSTVIETTTEPDATYRIRKCKECDFKFVSKEEITCMAVSLARRRWSGKKTDEPCRRNSRRHERRKPDRTACSDQANSFDRIYPAYDQPGW